MTDKIERWKDVPGLVLKYMVSDQGRVYSFYKWKYLSPGRMPGGHVSVVLDGKSRCVHELVLLAFVGPCPPGMQARHLNGIPDYNWLDNLEWNTRGINEYDKKVHGTNRRLHVSDIMSIKQAILLKSMTRKALAEKYGVSKSAIDAIGSGQNHAEVPAWPNL